MRGCGEWCGMGMGNDLVLGVGYGCRCGVVDDDWGWLCEYGYVGRWVVLCCVVGVGKG